MAGLLWALVLLLMVIWAFGFLIAHVGGAVVHFVLLAALVLLIWDLLSSSRGA